MGRSVRVGAAGVEGFSQDVSVPDMLLALRDELVTLEFAALRSVTREAT